MFNFDTETKPNINTFYKDIGIKLPIQVYLPENFSEDKKYKAVIAIHGGAWAAFKETPDSWDGGTMRHMAMYFRDKGLVGIVFSYRDIKFNETTDISDLIEDCNDALKFIKENYKFIDFENIVFSGDSAGGHLALSLAMDLTLKEGVAISPKAVLAYNPVTKCNCKLWGFCGIDEKHRKDASPIDNVKKIKPSILLMHGLSDTVVTIDDSREFYSKMKALENDIEMIERENEKHAFIIYGYTAPPENVKEDYRISEEYLLKKIKNLYD